MNRDIMYPLIIGDCGAVGKVKILLALALFFIQKNGLAHDYRGFFNSPTVPSFSVPSFSDTPAGSEKNNKP